MLSGHTIAGIEKGYRVTDTSSFVLGLKQAVLLKVTRKIISGCLELKTLELKTSTGAKTCPERALLKHKFL